MKFAFIVQPDWLFEHFGVRNLFASCAKILQNKGFLVDFIYFEQNEDKILFYKNFIPKNYNFSNVKKTTLGNGKSYKKLTKKLKKKKIKIKYTTEITQFLGCNITNDYDAFVMTNPWLIEYPIDFGNKPQILICYDCIANIHGILEDNKKELKWGLKHNTGYQFAKNKNMHFLSISPKIDAEIMKYYVPQKHSYLPPVPTYDFLNVEYYIEQKKENAIVLAAPFDKRKGLECMPDILNALKDDIDTLYIYGTPRCGKKLYKEFFKKLKIKNIIYYNEITTKDLIDLYKKSKMLFFPSIEEGLGLPIIEAQLCGCRVVTTNKAPMNELLCNGSYLLKNDFNTDIKNMKEMLNSDNFDYNKLSTEAKYKFSAENIYQNFKKVLH